MAVELQLKGKVLAWARITAGYTAGTAAERLQLPTERLLAYEREQRPINLTLARKLAALYKRPLSVLFLEELPSEPPEPPDFRRLPLRERGLGPETRFVIRRVRYWQSIASDLLEDKGRSVDTEPPFIGPSLHPEDAAARLRAWLGFPVHKQRTAKTPGEAFNAWRSVVESKDILVFVQSMPQEECRGFSLWQERSLPAAVINSKEVPQARTFTLLHELAHLAFRRAGICDESEEDSQQDIERFCNQTAAAMLIPPELLLQAISRSELSGKTSPEEMVEMVRRLSHASRPVSAIRLESSGAVPRGTYARLEKGWREEEWRPKGEGGPVPVARRVLSERGRLFTSLVLDSLERGRITRLEASEMLEVGSPTLPLVRDQLGG